MHLLAVLQRNLKAAFGRVQRRVQAVDERRGVGDEALALARQVQAVDLSLAAGGRGLPILALPVGQLAGAGAAGQAQIGGGGISDRGRHGLAVGLVIRQLAVQLVEHHERGVRAAFLDVGLLEQAVLLGAVRGLGIGDGRLPILVLHHQHGGVHPFAHVQVVVEALVDDDVDPAQAHGGIGAGAQRQPDIGFLAQVRLTRVHQDVVIGARCHVYRGTARVIVVRQLGSAAPLHVHARTADGLHPAVSVVVVELRGIETRAFADLVGLDRVRAYEALLQRRVRAHGPDAAGAGHAEVRLVAVLGLQLAELLADGLHGFVPSDALPAGIVGILRVRALHGVLQAIGMICSLQRGLALGAVIAHGLEGGLVAFAADDLSILHIHPHAAFHLAAAAAGGTDALDLAGAGGAGFGLGQRRACRSRNADGGGGGRSHLRERAARHRELAHASSFPSTPCKAPSPLWSYGIAALVFGCLPPLFSGSRGFPRPCETSPRPGLAWGLGPSPRCVRLPDDTTRKASVESGRQHG